MKNQPWQDETVQALKQGYQETIDKQAAEIKELKEWKLAIDEACVINWVNMTTPEETVNNLIVWNVKMALDPAISEQPAKWVARIAELKMALNGALLNEGQDPCLLPRINPCHCWRCNARAALQESQ